MVDSYQINRKKLLIIKNFGEQITEFRTEQELNNYISKILEDMD
jgi:hypothetical protein